MAVEVHISEEIADYYLEAYTGDMRLAYVAGYRDYDLGEEEQLKTWLDLRNKLKEAYETYPDGEVAVKLVIKDDWVNV